jgi:predicted Zn-dependent protease
VCVDIVTDVSWLTSRTAVGETQWYTGRPGAIVVIRPTLDPMYLRWVLLHELGHVLGLEHTTDITSVMYSGYSSHIGSEAWGTPELWIDQLVELL